MQVSELSACCEHFRTWLQKLRPMQKLGSDESKKLFMDICGGRVGGGITERLLHVGDVSVKVTDLSRFSFFVRTAGGESCLIARFKVFLKLHHASLASSG